MCDIIKLLHVIEYFAKKDNKICRALISKWSIVKEIKGVLQCPYFATIRLQKKDLTMSDAFGIWLEMDLQLKQVMRKSKNTHLAAKLIDAFKVRRQKIFQSEAMICAIYLDPRFRSEITEHEQFSTSEDAKSKLIALWNRFNAMEKRDAMEKSDVNASTTNKKKKTNEIVRTSFDPIDVSQEMNEYLRRGAQPIAENYNATSSTDISSELEEFDPEWLSMDNSVVHFWQGSKDKYPELYKVAMAIYSIPPTEVQIERDFSVLDRILTKLRVKLSAEMIESILMINLNPDLFFLVRDEKLFILKSKVVRSLFHDI